MKGLERQIWILKTRRRCDIRSWGICNSGPLLAFKCGIYIDLASRRQFEILQMFEYFRPYRWVRNGSNRTHCQFWPFKLCNFLKYLLETNTDCTTIFWAQTNDDINKVLAAKITVHVFDLQLQVRVGYRKFALVFDEKDYICHVLNKLIMLEVEAHLSKCSLEDQCKCFLCACVLERTRSMC